MTVTARDIEKLRAIDIYVKRRPLGVVWMSECPWSLELGPAHEVGTVLMTEEEGWQRCKAYVQSPDGMKATMADKIRFLDYVYIEGDKDAGRWFACLDNTGPDSPDFIGRSDSPEAAVDLLFWLVP